MFSKAALHPRLPLPARLNFDDWNELFCWQHSRQQHIVWIKPPQQNYLTGDYDNSLCTNNFLISAVLCFIFFYLSCLIKRLKNKMFSPDRLLPPSLVIFPTLFSASLPLIWFFSPKAYWFGPRSIQQEFCGRWNLKKKTWHVTQRQHNTGREAMKVLM